MHNKLFFAVREAFGDFVSDWKTERFIARCGFIVIEICSLIVLACLAFYTQAMIQATKKFLFFRTFSLQCVFIAFV